MSKYDKNTVHKTQLLDQVPFNTIYIKKGREAGPVVNLFDYGIILIDRIKYFNSTLDFSTG